jgi:ribosomal protein S18 acetylase RimI-like enzyme
MHTPRSMPMILFRTMDDRVRVRRATALDAADISTLYLQFLRSYGYDSECEAVVRFLEYMLAQSWVLFFVAADASDKILGFAGCTLTYSAVSQSAAIAINDMFVDADARRNGVATALCGAIEFYARRNGFVKIFLETAPDAEAAIAMYKKVGFEEKPYLAMTKEVADV